MFPDGGTQPDTTSLLLEFLPDGHRPDIQRHPRRQLQHAARRAADGDPRRARRHEGSRHRRLSRPPCRHRDQQHRSDASRRRRWRRARPSRWSTTKRRASNGGSGRRRRHRLRLRGRISARPVHQFRAAQLRLRGQPHHQQSVQDRRQSRCRARAPAANAGDGANVIAIIGSYQAHGTSGDDTSSGQGVYSFVAQGNFVFNFTDDSGKSNNKYLKQITLTKLQFSFDDETRRRPPKARHHPHQRAFRHLGQTSSSTNSRCSTCSRSRSWSSPISASTSAST